MMGETAMNFDIDCLRSFVLVADTMSVSRAADGVGRSQSTVSQQIAKLETQVGKSFAVTSQRQGHRTDLGRWEATSVRAAHLAIERRGLRFNVRRRADGLRPAWSTITTSSGATLPTWISLFKNIHPMVGLEIEANQSENLVKRSERGDFDLTFFKQETGAKTARLRCANSLSGLVARTTARRSPIPSR
jgi:DNA-binding transcriptional LysR family regulator